MQTPQDDLNDVAKSNLIAGAVKHKTSKFLKLINFTASTAFVCTVAWGGLTLGDNLWTMEMPIFGSKNVTGFGLDVKKSFEANHLYLIKAFAKDPDIKKIKQIKLQTRLNFSLSDFSSLSQEAHAIPRDNYINISIPQMQKTYEENLSIKQKIQNNRERGISPHSSMKEFFLADGGQEAVYNFFLNVEDGQKILIPDYIYFHEFTHLYLNDKLKTLDKEIKSNFALNKLSYSPNNSNVLSESVSDVLGILLTIDKHNLNNDAAISFIEARIAHRFTARSLTPESAGEIEHDTEFAIYTLLKRIKALGVEEIKALPIEEKVAIALDYGQRSMYYSNFTENKRFSERDTLILTELIFQERGNDKSIEAGEKLDGAAQSIADISKKRSFFLRSITDGASEKPAFSKLGNKNK